MKANSLRVITLLAISILLLSGLATAQGPQPPAPPYPPQEPATPETLPSWEPEFGKPFGPLPSPPLPRCGRGAGGEGQFHPPRPAGAVASGMCKRLG
jgi:hypothetical protein